MMNPKTSTSVIVGVFALMTVAGAAQGAIMIGSNAASGVGNTNSTFTGTIDYAPQTSTTGLLTIVLTNTSNVALNSRLTAFVFNAGSAASPSSLLLTAVGATVSNISGGSASPFGSTFVGGAGVGGQFEGGGNPSSGISPGQTGTFTFRITTASAPTLSASDFLSGPYAQNFVVRFRGLSDGSSSKIPAVLVPTPGTGALALVGVLTMSRRKRA
ncbi:MAG: hypothetical protein J0L61_06675 [Planctomycetes bacterium]|nr:hypothetical protein [Planctomycetota bacterium]